VDVITTSTCDDAELCDELRVDGISTFAVTYQGDPPSREIAAVPGFRLIVDLSPLTVGHMLLVPEDHYLSFGHLNAVQLDHVRAILALLRPLYVTAFGQMTVLEHGSSSRTPSACITHAHWHIVPVAGSQLADVLIGDGLIATQLPDFTALRRFAVADHPYYYCCLDGDTHLVFDAQRRIRAQYLRSAVGTVLGIADPEWDWSVVIRKDLLRATMTATNGWRERLT
jgi:diadenosine tetraphosphate (Ap4A) HIT family hydrolase